MSVQFWGFSVLYPLNLYIFEAAFNLFSPKNTQQKHSIKVKVASIIFSCSILLAFVKFTKFDFSISPGILHWFGIGLLPFIIPWIYVEVEEEKGAFLFWRNFVIAPACEELYYRILLPKLCDSTLLLSISFSLAHAHPLLFTKNWISSILKMILGQCVISFCFALICNRIRIKSGASENNFWIFLALSVLHGVANYCGVPFVADKNRVNWIQGLILVACLYLILK